MSYVVPTRRFLPPEIHSPFIMFNNYATMVAKDKERKSSESSDVGFTLVALDEAGFLDRNAKVADCPGCYIFPESSVFAVGIKLAGKCDAILFESAINRWEIENLNSTYFCKTLSNYLSWNFMAERLTIVVPIGVSENKSAEIEHAVCCILRYDLVEKSVRHAIYDPHGYAGMYSKVLDTVSTKIVGMFEFCKDVKSFATKLPLDVQKVGVQSISGLSRLTPDEISLAPIIAEKDASAESFKSMLPATVDETRDTYLAKYFAEENRFANVGDLEGYCSAFTMIMTFLACLFYDKTPSELEWDMFKVYRNASLGKGQKFDDLLVFGFKNTGRVFSRSLAVFESSLNIDFPGQVVCCTSPDGKKTTHNGTVTQLSSKEMDWLAMKFT